MSDKIERIIDALRKKILESAIRGELVPQNPEDEPASKLLERIAEERERMIKEKKIKKPKSVSRIFRRDGHFYESINGGEPTCIDDDIPFDIPDSWEWVKLSSIADVKGGKRIPAGMQTTTEKTAHVYIRVADMVNGTISDRNLVYITEEVFQKISRYTISKNDLYLTIAGTIGKAGVVPELLDGMNLTENAVKITNISVNKDFLLQLLQSDFCQSQFVDKTTCVAQPKLAIERILSVMLPIPPPNEQNRILDSVSNRFKKLNAIIDSRRKYKRILSETPTSLRQQLIQAAIQGRLVSQNPDDEPASVLLKRIAQERTAKLGKKAAKSMSRIERRGSKTYELFPDGTEKDISDDIPFEIPTSWEWAKGKSIFEETKNGAPERDFSYIDIDAIDNKQHIIKSGKPTKKEDAPSRARRILESGDVLFSLVRPYLENIALVGNQYANAIASTGFYVVRTKVLIPDFTYSLFLSPYVIQGLNTFMKGDNSPSIRSENIEDFLYPIPPLQEQQRIARALYKILSYIAL